jgi:hypothetical protein
MTRSPYSGLPATAFWKTGVSEQHPSTVTGLYKKRFALPEDGIATAGSCFAQHIARRLRDNGYGVIDAEPPPAGLSPENAQKFGYVTYSGRYGNVYTTRQLVQLAREALGQFRPAEPIWEKKGRFFDAMRPSVEPDGLPSAELVAAHRDAHIRKVRQILLTARLFVFTFGLTEAWVHKESGTVYPTAPGTIAGDFDPDRFEFKNFTAQEVLADFLMFRNMIKRINPDVRFLLTVSPVPLTATATDLHVLLATTYSKSVLRAVAGELYDRFEDVDYFPSYEIIASPFGRGFFYEPNLRAVSPAGVDAVMRVFFSEHARAVAKPANRAPTREEVQCEEALLEAFAR